jgi:AcrR family transcriptional regulator
VDGPGFAQIAEIQRTRIVAGMVDAACERGAANVTIADVVARSGVSRRTFYEIFSDREDCFLAAFEDALALASARVRSACGSERRWVDQLRAGLSALLLFLDEEPKLGRLLVCESLCERRVLARRNQAIAQLAGFVDEGRHERRSGQGAVAPPLLYAEGAVGGALSILHNLFAAGETGPYVELTGQLMAMIVLPYRGPAAAHRELARPIEAAPAHRPPASGSLAGLFKDAGMRLTYRTVRVLMSVAELGREGVCPSNKQIGDRAEVRDQGQISKLLHRLQRAGLIDNKGARPGQGAPNAWRLTADGERLTDLIRTRAESRSRYDGGEAT